MIKKIYRGKKLDNGEIVTGDMLTCIGGHYYISNTTTDENYEVNRWDIDNYGQEVDIRITLFRGKLPGCSKWVYGDLIQQKETAKYWYIRPWKCMHPLLNEEPDPLNETDGVDKVELVKVIPRTVGQWTGERDMFGRMVFEGDIVSYQGWDGRFKEPKEKGRYDMQLISFYDGAFTYKPIKTLIWEYGKNSPKEIRYKYNKNAEDGVSFCDIEQNNNLNKDYIVIGNKYDNADLLEENK